MMYHHWTHWAVQNLSSIGIAVIVLAFVLVDDVFVFVTFQDADVLVVGVTGTTCVIISIIIVVILLLGNDNIICFGEIQHL